MYTEARLASGCVLEYLDLGDPDGFPVVYQPGTPNTAGTGALLDAAARRHGVRLLSVSRPGYGASTLTPPGLASVGRQIREVAASLGITEFGTLGSSGGGPYALATASVAPASVTRVVVAAGVGPTPVEDREDEDSVAVARQFADHLLALDDEAFQLALKAGRPSNEHYFDERPAEAAVFFADFRRALDPPDGFARDNLSWGGDWDVDLSQVSTPVHLVYGDADQMVAPENGHRLAALLPGSTLAVLPGAGHGDVTFAAMDRLLALFE